MQSKMRCKEGRRIGCTTTFDEKIIIYKKLTNGILQYIFLKINSYKYNIYLNIKYM